MQKRFVIGARKKEGREPGADITMYSPGEGEGYLPRQLGAMRAEEAEKMEVAARNKGSHAAGISLCRCYAMIPKNHKMRKDQEDHEVGPVRGRGAEAASAESLSLSFCFQKCMRRLIRRPFLLVLSGESPGGFSSWLNLLRSEGPLISLDRLAKLDRFGEFAGSVRRLRPTENDAARLVDGRARAKKVAEKRCMVFVMVDALLVRDGTSSTDACGNSEGK